jgi:hypothetical protein
MQLKRNEVVVLHLVDAAVSGLWAEKPVSEKDGKSARPVDLFNCDRN